jgi:hypothetical protein
MRGRCDEMKKAIRLAHEKYQILNNSNFKLSITDDAKTLKLFMAPEFFFRGIHGAYDISKVAEILGHLRKETDQTKYKDWLFVFGTAIGASMSTETHCTV